MSVSVSRRDFMRVAGLTGTLAALAACDPLRRENVTAPSEPGPPLAPTGIPLQTEGDFVAHTLRRATFGSRRDELLAAEQMGIEAWLEAQMNPEGFDQSDVESRLGQLETLDMSPGELRDLQQNGQIARQLVASALIRQIYSPAQLYEVMVDFWTNHFNIHAFATPEIFLKGQDDREVIRAHALGSFPQMLAASAHSPAMLVYLDNAQSRQPSPNENYARELLELHSLGVDGGYTYNDIQAVARAFTGWSVTGFRRSDRPGQFAYLSNWHDEGSKTVLGQTPPGGKGDGDRVLELLAEHPSTARFIATKMTSRFVSDDPPAPLVDRVAQTYTDTGGDIPSMLRAIFFSDEFAASSGLKFKRPLDYLVSVLRVTRADGELERILRFYLEALGQLPFGWPAPDGYPDYAAAWTSTSQTLYRWNLALTVTSGMMRGVQVSLETPTGGAVESTVDSLTSELLGQILPEDARTILIEFGESYQAIAGVPLRSALAGLILSTPHFQLR